MKDEGSFSLVLLTKLYDKGMLKLTKHIKIKYYKRVKRYALCIDISTCSITKKYNKYIINNTYKSIINNIYV